MSKRPLPPGVPWDPVPAGDYQPHGHKLTVQERAVLGVLLGMWAREGSDRLRIPMARLSARAGIGRTAAYAAVRGLEAKGLISVEANHGGHAQWTAYRLTLPEIKTVRETDGIGAKPSARRTVTSQEPSARNTVLDGHTYPRGKTPQVAPLRGAPAPDADVFVDASGFVHRRPGTRPTILAEATA